MADQPTNDTTKAAARPYIWTLGLLLLIGAAAASGIMSLKSMGVLGDNLPGCGAQSACDAVTNGPFGTIPGLGWPVSFVGFAYFCGMLFAWTYCTCAVPSKLRTLVRLSVLASFMFLVIMVIEGSLCPYCLTTHLCNIAFWGIIECLPSRREQRNFVPGVVAWLCMFALVTVALGMGQSHRDAIMAPVHEAARQANEEALLAATTKPRTGDSQSFRGRYLRGPENADIQIVMFSDFQCPDCRDKEREIALLMDLFPNVSMSIKNFPFNSDCNDYFPKVMHANACWAARSAEAAGILGGDDAFWQWHDWLFLNSGKFVGGKLPGLVEELGFDRREFTELMASDYVNDLVREDIEEAQQLGIFYTPMLFINGVQHKWVIPGTPSLQSVVTRLAAAIERGEEGLNPRRPDSKKQKYIADWRDARPRQFRNPSQPFTVAYGSGPGAADPIDLIVFGDYTSDNTSRLFREIEAAGIPVNVTMRVYPLEHACNTKLNRSNPGSPGACMSTRAVKAAGVVGGDAAYQTMHDWAFANQPRLPAMDEAAWTAIAAQQGLDLAEFLDAMTGPVVSRLISEDITEAARLRFRNVPAIYVQGAQVPRPFLDNELIITAVLKEAAAR